MTIASKISFFAAHIKYRTSLQEVEAFGMSESSSSDESMAFIVAMHSTRRSAGSRVAGLMKTLANRGGISNIPLISFSTS